MNNLKNITMPQAIIMVAMVGAYFAAHYVLGTNAGHVTATIDMVIAYMMNSNSPEVKS